MTCFYLNTNSLMLLPVSLTPENNTDDNKYESNAKETVIDMARTVG